MPTKRTWRERETVAFPSAYCAAELLTGEISYPVRGYTGYGDGTGEDLRAFIDDVMRADWAVHRDALKPWLFYRGAPGTRPWAWWWLEEHPPIGEDESEDEYLTHTEQWLPGEREPFEAAERAPEPDDDDADLIDR